jgi:hypothetical protein
VNLIKPSQFLRIKHEKQHVSRNVVVLLLGFEKIKLIN